ncbi:MAG: hypothetical protein IPG45_38990 [Deltaproteobacteria bacterium]|nr:hypothetical protein [Deltaproteobacteria bacterium]
MRPCPRSFGLLFALAFLACGKDATYGLGEQDSGDPGGDGAVFDTGSVADLGFDDFGFPIDSGELGPDTGVSQDTGTSDIGTISDGGEFDSGTKSDSGFVIPDGAVPDTGTKTDGGVVLPDGGPRPDTGVTPDGGAVECTSDQDCGIFGVFGHCDLNTNQCVECLEDSHCGGNGVCDLAAGNVCRRPCSPNGNCFGGDVCDPSINACVECLADTDCDVGEICNPSARSCQECFTNADCALQPNQPICGSAGQCVGCAADSDCGAGEICFTEQGGWCVAPQARGLCEPCDDDDQCGGPEDLCIGYLANNTIFDRSCGTDCSQGQACPSGYQCISVRQGSAQQCRPRYDMQTPTCTAVRNLGLTCLSDPNATDLGCGISGVQDARCFASTTTPGICAIWCDDPDQCPTGFTCQQIGNQGYCL